MTKNILALIDFSQLSNKIVAKAGELATIYDAKCWLMHVATPDPEFVGYEVGPQYIRDSRALMLKKERQKLQDYKRKLVKDGVNCQVLMVQGYIHPTLNLEINKLKIDMVILGSHGHGKLHNILVGSVCEYMVHHATVPLLIIPAKEKFLST